MPERTIQEQIVKYLGDVHAIEEQALPQVKAAPKLAGDPTIADAFERHIGETENHEQRVRERLEALGGKPNKVKDVAGAASGPAFVLFAKSQPDTPGKLVTHAYSYEHMELAAYELLARAARRAGDQAVVDLAGRIGEQERAMGERLAERFDVAVEASLREKDTDDIESELVSYLTDAHAIEAQALQLLGTGPKIAGFDELADVFQEHLGETEEQQRLVEERLRAHGAGPSRFQRAGMRMGALNLGAFFTAQPDTPAKLAGFAYAFEHLEIAGYELLRRVAERANDPETVAVAERIVAEERRAAERIAGTWDAAMDAALAGLVAGPAG